MFSRDLVAMLADFQPCYGGGQEMCSWEGAQETLELLMIA